MRWPGHPKKSPLKPREKALAACRALDQFIAGKDPKSIGAALREEVGLQWTVLTAVQYLTGKEARDALDALPADFVFEGRNKFELKLLEALANDCAANAHPHGTRLSAGLLVEKFKRARLNADVVATSEQRDG